MNVQYLKKKYDKTHIKRHEVQCRKEYTKIMNTIMSLGTQKM